MRADLLSAALDAETEGKWESAMLLRIEAAERFPFQAVPVWSIRSRGGLPWDRGSWHGELISLDGCPVYDFTLNDVVGVIGHGDSSDEWDGESAGIARLTDGRWISWESNWGPTGSGFYEDAYGGDADIWFSLTPGIALEKISERGRELIVWS